jgi:hypothetical protein
MRRFGRNTRYRRISSVALLKSIVEGREGELLRAVALVEYPEVLEDLKNNVCPACGFRARRWVSLYAHIVRTRCLATVSFVVRDIINSYERARQFIEREVYVSHTRWRIKYQTTWYSTAEEAYRALRSMDAIVVG